MKGVAGRTYQHIRRKGCHDTMKPGYHNTAVCRHGDVTTTVNTQIVRGDFGLQQRLTLGSLIFLFNVLVLSLTKAIAHNGYICSARGAVVE